MGGDASAASLENLFDQALNKGYVPKKYSIVSDWVGRVPTEYWSDDWKKEYEKAKKLSVVDSTFTNSINSKLPVVQSSGQYEFRLSKKGQYLTFLMVDSKAEFIYEYFIGVMQVQVESNSYRITPKKAFGLEVYGVHWSNVAAERMGQGLGKLMYTMLYTYVSSLNAALVSDSILYQGSQKMWFDYIPSIAPYFGIVINSIFLPINKEEMKSNGRSLAGDSSVDRVVAMKSPPELIRKIAYNFKGLSFQNGEYGVFIAYNTSVNEKFVDRNDHKKWKYFSNLVDEATSISELFKMFKTWRPNFDIDDAIIYGRNASNIKALVFSFSNANIIVKESGGKLVMVAV